MMVLPSSAVFHPVLTRWDLDFCLWHVGSCFPKRIERFLLPSQSTWQSLNSQGMFSASSLWDVLSLSACFIFATFWPCYKTLLHRSVLLRTAHVLVVLVCCTKHDVMRRCRGLVLTSPFSVFYQGGGLVWYIFTRSRMRGPGKTGNVTMLFLKLPSYKLLGRDRNKKVL